MRSTLRVAIATAGRFHVFDLARELHALGYDVTLYSYVPRRRARRYGIEDECYVGLLPFAAPALICQRFARRYFPRAAEWFLYKSLNWAVRIRLRPCNVFVCMSGIYVEAARYAKREFNAKVWIERGSQHILSQDEILRGIAGAERPSALTIKRELEGYDMADRIVVPSKHVEDSFRRDPSAFAKLFRNPLGVDLDAFPLREPRQTHQPFTLLFVGNWSLRKGCDLLAKAVANVPDVRLLHVGPVSDARFPGDGRFVHVDTVSQTALPQYYAQADALVLPSREDGFGMVILQALAVGLPIICTDRTGGPDLAYTPSLAERITIVPAGNTAALAAAIEALRKRLTSGGGLPPLTQMDRQQLSWTSYALRYSDELRRKIG